MTRFWITLDGQALGWSALDGGDPPMGVASGRLHPSDGYERLRGRLAGTHGLVVAADDGAELHPAGGILIEDMFDALGEEGRVVTLLGLPRDEYERSFRAQLEAYERSFGAGSDLQEGAP